MTPYFNRQRRSGLFHEQVAKETEQSEVSNLKPELQVSFNPKVPKHDEVLEGAKVSDFNCQK